MSSNLVVVDAGPLIGLDKIGRLDLLERLFGGVVVPSAVAREIAPSVAPRSWLREQPLATPVPIAVLEANLDPGEAEAIALALELRPIWLVLDDRRARRLADRLGLPVIGTLGILRSAKLLGVVDHVRPLVEALRATRFFVNDRLVEQLLEELGET